MVFAGVDPIYDPIPVRPGRPLPHGWRRDRRPRPDRAAGPLRRRRGRLRLGARREPPRRQRADGDDHLRPARRPRRRRERASASTSREVPASALRDAEARARRRCSRAARASGPGGSATSSPRRCIENFGVFRREEQMAEQGEIIEGLRERYERRRRRGQGRGLQQRPHPGARARLPARARRSAWSSPASRARRAAAPTRVPTTSPSATTRTSCATLDRPLGRRRARARLEPGDDHQVAAGGEELLMQVALKIWRADAATRRARAARLRGRRARVGDAARRARHRQGPPRRDARLPQELPDDDLRLLRDADGRRRGARLQDADVRRSPQAGHVPVISAMGNLPIVKDLVVDMDPFWAKFRAVDPVPAAGLHGAAGRPRARDLAGADERDPQGVALHQLRLLRLGVQLDGVEPGVPRPAGARQGDALRRRPARRRRSSRGSRRSTASTGSGSARAATSATSAAPRASTRATRSPSSAPSRSRRGSTATWARSTRSGSSPRRRRPAGCARPSSCRRRRASSRRSSRRASRSASRASARCRRRSRRTSRRTCSESRRLYDLSASRAARGYAGHRPGRAGARAARARPARRRRARPLRRRARSRGRTSPASRRP